MEDRCTYARGVPRSLVEVYLSFPRDTASIDLGSTETSGIDDHAILRSMYRSTTAHQWISSRKTDGEG